MDNEARERGRWVWKALWPPLLMLGVGVGITLLVRIGASLLVTAFHRLGRAEWAQNKGLIIGTSFAIFGLPILVAMNVVALRRKRRRNRLRGDGIITRG